jgi:hypothetical protein
MIRRAASCWRIGACCAGLLSLSACSTNLTKGAEVAAPAPCVAEPVDISRDTRILNILRVYTGTDGVSHAEVQNQPAQESTYLGALLRQFQLGAPSNVVIVSGPPDFRIPQHPAPYREIFLQLAGSSTIELSDGTRHPLHAGSVVLFEDLTGPGHAGLFGACGYVALDMQFKPPAR